MAKSDIRLEGLDEVLKQLDGTPAQLIARLRPVVAKHTASIRSKVDATVPVGPTGNLKAGIRDEVAEGDDWIFGRVASTAPHSHLLEYGTVKMAAQPFLTPAYEAVKSAFESDAKTALSE